MFVVDTNILVYASDQDAREHDLCRGLLQAWREQPGAWYVTWGILYEFVHVTTDSRVVRRPWSLREAWRFVDALLASPGLGLLVETQRHSAVVSETAGGFPEVAGNLVHDFHTAVLMREHGIKMIYTRNVAFRGFPFLEPVDPVRL